MDVEVDVDPHVTTRASDDLCRDDVRKRRRSRTGIDIDTDPDLLVDDDDDHRLDDHGKNRRLCPL